MEDDKEHQELAQGGRALLTVKKEIMTSQALYNEIECEK